MFQLAENQNTFIEENIYDKNMVAIISFYDSGIVHTNIFMNTSNDSSNHSQYWKSAFNNKLNFANNKTP